MRGGREIQREKEPPAKPKYGSGTVCSSKMRSSIAPRQFVGRGFLQGIFGEVFSLGLLVVLGRVSVREPTGKGCIHAEGVVATKQPAGVGVGGNSPPRMTARPMGGQRGQESFPVHSPTTPSSEQGISNFLPIPIGLITIILPPQIYFSHA